MTLPPLSLMLAEQLTVVRRAVLAVGAQLDWIPGACGQVARHLYRQRVVAIGYPFARCHQLADGLLGVEAGFPVGAAVRSTGLIVPSTLPAGPALSVRYTGVHEGAVTAYRAIDEWLQAEGYSADGDSWEIYRDLPSCPRVGYHLEVVQPIRYARIAH